MPALKKKVPLKAKKAEKEKSSNEKYEGFSNYPEYAQDIIVSPSDRLFAAMESRQKKLQKQSS